MIKWIHLSIFLCWLNLVSGQNINVDSIENLKKQLASPMDDASKVDLLGRLSGAYIWTRADSGLLYADMGLQIAKRINYNYGEAVCSINLSVCLIQKGNFTSALDFGYKALAIFENLQDTKNRRFSHVILMICYRDQGDYQQALIQGYKAKEFGPFSLRDSVNILTNISSVYEKSNKLDSALFYGQKVYKMNEQHIPELITLGNIYSKMGDQKAALNYYEKGIGRASGWSLMDLYLGISKALESTHEVNSSISNAKKSFLVGKAIGNPLGMHEASRQLAHLFELRNQSDSVVKYLKLSVSLNDSLFNNQKVREAQSFAFNEKLHQQDLERQQLQYANQFKMYGLISILFFLLLIAFIQYKNNKRKQEANIQLQQQKEKVESTLGELKSTQSQLIQSEKMASLGELTAGIAHEIQNPLNFVNNFSEINKELIQEFKSQRLKVKGERDEHVETQLLNDIEENETKINNHGKRADAIVKGMLLHSQKSAEVKEPTNINVLVEEYYRLAYQSYISKEKLSTEIKLVTDLDTHLPLVNVIPQDIGRVMLNLYNNAFWFLSEASAPASRSRTEGWKDRAVSSVALAKEGAVGEKAKRQGVSFETHPVLEDYIPTITLTTKYLGNSIEIYVKDNGPGIPQNMIDKIFQPFFTTKPTGQGTGLGLSLAYDIIKAHGGTITVRGFNEPPVETIKAKMNEGSPESALDAKKESGIGCEFIINLPVHQ